MRIHRDLGRWMAAVGKAWLGYVSSGAITVFMGIGHALGWWNPKPSVYLWVLAFGVAVSMFQSWLSEHIAKESLLNPLMTFTARVDSCLQRDNSLHAVYTRIAITNDSAAVAKDCHLKIENWSFSAVGLNRDTPLLIKDEPNGGRHTNINVKDTKQFELFITRLNWGGDVAESTLVGAPNYPEITNGHSTGSITLRLTGENFTPRWYRALLVFRGNAIEITRLDEVNKT